MMQWMLLGVAVFCALLSMACSNEGFDFIAIALAVTGLILGCAAASITVY